MTLLKVGQNQFKDTFDHQNRDFLQKCFPTVNDLIIHLPDKKLLIPFQNSPFYFWLLYLSPLKHIFRFLKNLKKAYILPLQSNFWITLYSWVKYYKIVLKGTLRFWNFAVWVFVLRFWNFAWGPIYQKYMESRAP